jgi:hypothetical protein
LQLTILIAASTPPLPHQSTHSRLKAPRRLRSIPLLLRDRPRVRRDRSVTSLVLPTPLESAKPALLLRMGNVDSLHRQLREPVSPADRAAQRPRVAHIHTPIAHALAKVLCMLRLRNVVTARASAPAAHHGDGLLSSKPARYPDNTRRACGADNWVLDDHSRRSLGNTGRFAGRFRGADRLDSRTGGWSNSRYEADCLPS